MGIAVNLSEYEKGSPASHRQLTGVKLPTDEKSRALIEGLSKRILKISQHNRGVSLEANSYVGRIRIGDLQVTIHPKLPGLPLLRLMRYAYHLGDIHLYSVVEFGIENMSFQDLLIYQFINEVSRLLSCGLKRQYVRREEMLHTPRGRIALKKVVSRAGHIQERIPCDYYLRLEDTFINQVLLQGIQLAIRLTDNDTLKTELQHLEHYHFMGISALALDLQVLGRLRREINRLTEVYLPAIKIIEILFAARGISIEEQVEMQLPGFLFDMNQFYQELLYRFLKEYLPEYEVLGQNNLDTIMEYVENPRRRRTPQLRPDYRITGKHGQEVEILDAKYRDLWEKDLPSHMLYQLIMYSIGQNVCNRATILYPTLAADAREAKIYVNIPVHPQGGISIIQRPVNMYQLDKLLVDAREKHNEQKCTEYARWLAFGYET